MLNIKYSTCKINKMRLTSLITITFIIILIPFKLCLSQNTKSFSQLPELYINELSDFFQSIDKKEDKSKCLQVFQDFKKEWESNKFSPKQQDKIYKTSNLMLNKKMKVYPHFYNYLLTLISLSNNQHFEKVFNPVHNSVNFVLNSSHKRSFIEYLEALNDVFTDNFLYYSQTTVWKSDKVFTDFIFDSIPRFIFKDITLTCYANKDSSCILNTSGIYYPLNNKWKGNEGKVSWKRAGFSEDSVFSKLNKYEITLKYYKYSADSAALYYKNWFSKPLLGRIEEKVRADVNEEKASYPRFDSYDKRIYVKNIFDLVDYKGGFSLYGSRLIGKGDKDNPANVIFKRKKQKFIVISSQAFIIKKDHIGTEKASATIYLNFFKNLNTKDSMNLNLQQMDSVNFNMRQKDSIYHPGLRMKYNKQNKELSLLRYEEGLA